MFYYLGLFLLAPLLVIQGRHVRRVTPRLPEPPGARAGQQGRGPLLRLLIAGDSAAAGVGAVHQDQALAGQLVQHLSGGYQVDWLLQAQTGHTSGDLLRSLERADRRAFDVVVLSIGVNDVTSRTRMDDWIVRVQAITRLLHRDYHAQRIYLTAIPPMHHFPALPNPLRWWLGLRARQLNGILQQLAAADDYLEFVQIPYQLRAGEIAADGFHPGAEAYRSWAAEVARRIETRAD